MIGEERVRGNGEWVMVMHSMIDPLTSPMSPFHMPMAAQLMVPNPYTREPVSEGM